MKMLIISDIHANVTALENIWEREGGADLVACAGDCVDFGLNPHEVVAWLREKNAIVVAGNHDHEILDRYASEGVVELKEELLFAQYNIQNLTKEDLDWLASLPDEITFEFDGKTYFMTHSFDLMHMHYIAESLNNFTTTALFAKLRREHAGMDNTQPLTIIEGHTHQCILSMPANGMMFLNPGSISYRVCDDHRAKGSDYIVVEDGAFRFEHTYYDSKPLIEKATALPLSAEHKRLAHSFWDAEVLPE